MKLVGFRFRFPSWPMPGGGFSGGRGPIAGGLFSGVNLASVGDKDSWKAALSVMSLGIEMGVAVAVGYFAGDWLDRKLGTAPWLMYVFLVLGIAASFRALWRTARKHWNDGE